MATNVSTIGTTGTYATLSLWEAATDNDLVTAGDIEQGEFQNETHTISSTVTLTGATTNAANYRVLTVVTAGEHNGTRAGVNTVIDLSTGGSILHDEDYVRFVGLAIDGTNKTSGFGIGHTTGTRTGIIVEKCLIYDGPSGVSHAIGGSAGGTYGMTIRNNIVLNWDHHAIHCGRMDDAVVINNTFVRTGLLGTNGVFGITTATVDTFQNNLVLDSGGSADVSVTSEPATNNSNNAVSKGTVPGTSGLLVVSADTCVNVSSGTEDARLLFDAVVIDQGVDTSAFGGSTDIIGKTRPKGAGYDIGAREITVNKSTIGAGGVYANIVVWEAATDDDILADDRVEIGQAIVGVHDLFTIAVTYSGATTDQYRFRCLCAQDGGENKGIIDQGPIFKNSGGFTVSEPNFRMADFQFEAGAVFATANGVIFERLLGKDCVVALEGAFAIDGSKNDIIVRNCFASGGIDTVSVLGSGGTGILVYNNTGLNGSSHGFNNKGLATGITFKNNICLDSGLNDYNNTGFGTWDYNMSSDATAIGANSQTNVTSTDIVEDMTAGAEVVKLKAGSSAIDAGLNLFSAGVVDDIKMQARDAINPFDMGCWELFEYLSPTAQGGGFSRHLFLKPGRH